VSSEIQRLNRNSEQRGVHLSSLMRDTLKRLKHRLEDLLATAVLEFSILTFRNLSLRTVVFMSKILATLSFYCMRRYRKRVIGNLSTVFGLDKDRQQVRRLAKKIFFHLSLTALETIYSAANVILLDRFTWEIRIEGKERLDVALALGRGVIALGAHLGSFTLLGARVASEGYPFNSVINVGNFPKLWERLAFYQGMAGAKMIPLKPKATFLKKSLNCLRRNEILYIVADEQLRHGGLPVPFLDHIAYTPSGPAILSLKTGAPILPMFVVREDHFKRTLVIGNPIEIERTSDQKKDIETLTARFTKVIEETIRESPDQWAWLNRRWKLPRPEGFYYDQ
jgi:KDO2-lipid IV(A) lauroyltransferase